MTPITDCMKKGDFEWTKAGTRAFEQIKQKMTKAHVLKLPAFDKFFEVSCDASQVGVGRVLSQDGHLVAYFSEKLNDTRKKYSPHDLEYYAIVQALRHWPSLFN
eukprot:TRINITY_DN9123_c0_g1_i12.p1 TRINITY_DN9123_c0_g1~~TRINITY_DN9123_c0_g1_i12.p1  ORF type:complete len:104 (+),score=13.80 TRINITY_DN9123_c0_g1_i12:233-544(+)